MDKEYQKLNEQFTEDIFKNAEEQTTPAYQQQNKDQEQLLNMVAKVLLSYTIVDSVLLLGNNDEKSLTNKFNIAISDITKGQFTAEKSLMNDILTTATRDKYYTDAYITQIGMSFDLQKITDGEIAKVVNDSINNKLWSDRLWDNKEDLQSKLKKEVDSFLKGNTNVNQIEKSVKKRFNQNAYNTHRLVQSETARCQNDANDVFAENHGVESQMYTATLEGNTCAECGSLDGKVYKLDDVNKPAIPEHPLCRCCYINLPDRDWRPSSRRDQENNKVGDWTTYQDWYNENIIVEENVDKDINSKVNWNIVKSNEYKNKFQGIGKNDAVDNEIYKTSIRILNHRDGTKFEDLYILDLKTGKTITYTTQNTKMGIKRTDKLDGILSRKNSNYVVIHNHPHSSSFSTSDLKTLFNSKSVNKMLAICHNGTVFEINSKDLEVDIVKEFEKSYTKIRKYGYSENTAMEKALESLSDLYNLGYKRR